MSSAELLQQLIHKALAVLPSDGFVKTALPSVGIFRQSSESYCDSTIYKPCLVLTLQGQKDLNFGDKVKTLAAGQCLITSVDLPVVSRIVGATPDKPYISILFEVNESQVASLVSELGSQHRSGGSFDSDVVSITPANTETLAVLSRALDLLENPKDLAVLGPMLEREMIYRLLQSEQGERLRHVCISDSAGDKVLKAVRYLNEHFHQTVRVEDLASQVNMSVSSLHSHFKAVTSLTPLKYQKQLRLHEARKMIMRSTEVSAAAYQVGYESASQFSRDYSQLFGAPPSKDRAQQQAHWQLEQAG